MQAESIILQADQAGIELFLSGDCIAARPKSKLSADLRELIKTHREEVVRYLSCQWTPADLIRLTIQAGVTDHGLQLGEEEITSLVPPSDLRDVSKCEPQELKAWAACLALRAVRYRGKVPSGWDQVAQCANCGPVYSFAAGDCLACPWCELKRGGKWFPVPRKRDT